MTAAREDDMEMSQRLTSDASPVDDMRTRIPRKEPSERTCWQDFTASLSNFCGLVDEQQEESSKWQARLEDMKKDRLIGHGEVAQDETDGVPCIRPSPRIPISLTTTSKRCRRSQISEGKQAGIMSTAVDGVMDLLNNKPKKSKRKPQLRSRSFTPAAIREFGKSPIYKDYDDTDHAKGYSLDDGQLRNPGILNDSFFSDAVGTSFLYRRKRVSQYDNAQYASYGASGDTDEVDFGYSRKQ